MKDFTLKSYLLFAFAILPFIVRGQNVEIKGRVYDNHGEPLPLATVMIFPDSLFTTSHDDGAFALRVSSGMKQVHVTFTGFRSVTLHKEITRDTAFVFILHPRIDQLDEIVIERARYSNEDVVQSVFSSTHTLNRGDVLHIPSFMGESDLLNAVRLLPGTVSGMEGTSNLFVRGGAADQNLVLLDGGTIYNPGHLLGFLSVFNPDILEKVEVIHGGFPAEFGGRLSSILNISTISDIPDKTHVSTDIGLMTSRMKIEQPLVKDKASFWLAGRKSYVDKVVQKISGKEVPYGFHELNGKLLFRPSTCDHLELTHYNGGDFLDFMRDSDGDGRGMRTTYHANNSSQTFKWRHKMRTDWQSDLSMFHTRFAYRTENAYNKDYLVSANSDIEDIGGKVSLEKDSVWKDARITTGVEWIRHKISPKVLNSKGSISDLVENGSSGGKMVHEFAAYAQQEWSLLPRLKISAGIRGSMATVASRQYVFAEPRASLRYGFNNNRAIKFNYARMVQYLHRVSNSAVSTPIDVWFPVTDSIRPQTSHQFALGWQHLNSSRNIFYSVEGYYKEMNDLVSYEPGTNFLFKSEFESRLIQGRGRAYGLEVLVRKEAGRFTGWISYSLGWSWRNYAALNHGEWFRARYDRRHNGAVVAQHRIGKRWMASMVWEYISGARFTPVVAQYVTVAPNGAGLDLIPVFADINSVKLSDSHRLDLGIKFFSKPGSKIQWHWYAGVYNAYNRATPFGIVIKQNETDNSMSYSQPGLFGLLPFISYGCKF
ncbi:MAG TPA: TonB-dependent receptor [Chryseosolibacter sp.]|nr:TonB-dependent receptor [Chryseosolibacter sp.]